MYVILGRDARAATSVYIHPQITWNYIFLTLNVRNWGTPVARQSVRPMHKGCVIVTAGSNPTCSPLLDVIPPPAYSVSTKPP